METSLIYSEPLSTAAQLCLSALSQRSEDEESAWRASAKEFGSDSLLEFAREKGVFFALAEALGEDADRETQASLQRNRERVHALLNLGQEVAQRLDAEGIQNAYFESGGVLCASALPEAAFGSSDIDLLVPPRDWEPALRLLREMGLRVRQRRAEGVNRVELGREEGEHALYLDVAKTPFERMTAPLPFKDRSEVWLQGRVPSERFPGLCTLSPSVLLVQVAIHTSLHQYVLAPGLRLHIDVERLARDVRIDWDMVLSELECVGLPTRAFISLSMASELLGAQIPSRVLDALAPDTRRSEAISRILSARGLLSETPRPFGAIESLRLDRLLDERTHLAWLQGLLWPESGWLRARLERDGALAGPDVLLHVHRARRLLKRVLRAG